MELQYRSYCSLLWASIVIRPACTQRKNLTRPFYSWSLTKFLQRLGTPGRNGNGLKQTHAFDGKFNDFFLLLSRAAASSLSYRKLRFPPNLDLSRQRGQCGEAAPLGGLVVLAVAGHGKTADWSWPRYLMTSPSWLLFFLSSSQSQSSSSNQDLSSWFLAALVHPGNPNVQNNPLQV